MAVRSPLVIINGVVQQLPSGDSIGALETGQITLTATSTTVAGNAVYADGAGTFDLARANASGTTYCIGIAIEDIAASTSGQVQVNGVVTLTTGQWDAVCGTTGGLVAGTTYFLSAATAGEMTATAPTTVGQYVQVVIRALSTTSAIVNPSEPILL